MGSVSQATTMITQIVNNDTDLESAISPSHYNEHTLYTNMFNPEDSEVDL